MYDYEHGLRLLKERLPAEALPDFNIFEDSLKENRRRARLYGNNPMVSSERVEIVSHLNELAIEYCNVSFNELCERPVVRVGSMKPSSLRVSAELLTTTMPTAYCYNVTASEFPFVTVTLDNTTPGSVDVDVLVSATIDNYSDTHPEPSIKVAAGKMKQVPLLPVLKPDVLATLHDKRPATLRIVVKKTALPQDIIAVMSFSIRLHARDTALLELKMPNGSYNDFTRYLAAWVTPYHPEVEKVHAKAAQYHGLDGYVRSSNRLPDLAMDVREQVRALFQAVKDINLVYGASELDIDSEQVTQRVRLPGDILANGWATNCIDSSVLFASLLMAASIDPILVLVPGHAFVGWHIWRDIDQYEFLETTEINKCDFEAAQEAAQRRYDIAQIDGYHTRSLFDSSGFLRIIDVADCRKKKIQALSY